MAVARTSSSLFVTLFSTKLAHHSLLPSNLPLSHPHVTRIKNPTITICHARMNNLSGEERDELREGFFDGGDLMEDEEEESDEDERESSVDLLISFFQSMFRKISKRAKKASRSVLPPAISPHLVSFAVDGVLLLASFSIVKALLEVFCNLGGIIFVVILLLRGIWATVSYFQSSGGSFNQSRSSFGTA